MKATLIKALLYNNSTEAMRCLDSVPNLKTYKNEKASELGTFSSIIQKKTGNTKPLVYLPSNVKSYKKLCFKFIKE